MNLEIKLNGVNISIITTSAHNEESVQEIDQLLLQLIQKVSGTKKHSFSVSNCDSTSMLNQERIYRWFLACHFDKTQKAYKHIARRENRITAKEYHQRALESL